MACTTLTSIPANACLGNIGGIQKVWIFDMEDIVFTAGVSSVVEDPLTWTITAIDIDTPPVEFVFDTKQAAASSYTEELANDFVAGSAFYNQTLNLVFKRREASKSKALNILGEGQRRLGALVLDAMGQYVMFFDLQLATNADGSGVMYADGSKYTTSFTTMSLGLAKYVASADALAFIATGTIA